MGVLKLFEGTGDLYCAIATIKTSEGSMQKVVDGTAFSVGRAPDCVLSIPDVGISRLHLLVTIKRGEIYVTDQGSSNGTFINGERIEAKRLIHLKPSDEVKLGKSEVVIQLGCIEKHFKTDYIAESLLPVQEKDNLMGLIKASHHKAQEIVGMAQSQADQLVKVATEKARNTENQTLLLQEEILSKAHVESQQIISDNKRKGAQIIFDAEEKARDATKNIHQEAESRRQEADAYYQQKTSEAKETLDRAFQTENQARLMQEEILTKANAESQQILSDFKRKGAQIVFDAEEKAREVTKNIHQEANKRRHEAEAYYQQKLNEAKIQGDEIIEKQTALGQQMIEELRVKTIEKAEQEAKEQLSGLFGIIDEKSEELEIIKAEVKTHRDEQKTLLDAELKKFRADFIKKFDYEKQSALDEHQNRMALLESDYLHKKQEQDESESNRLHQIEDRLRKLNEKLDLEYADKRVRLERDYADRLTTVERELSSRKSFLEEDFQTRQIKLTEDYEKNKNEFTISLEKQRAMLEKEVESQRHNLHVVRSEIDDISEKHLELKSKFESLTNTVKELRKTETEIIQTVAEKRKDLDSVLAEHRRVSDLIVENDVKYTELQKSYANLKTQFEADHLAYRKEIDTEMQRVRAEIKRKTSEYEELEKIKHDEYKNQLLVEKKQLDTNFERLKKEYELKTKEAIEFEKKKLEASKEQFLALMNSQRALVTNELTKAIIKIEKKGDQAHSSELISHAVNSVFDSHVAEFSLTANTQNTVENTRKVKVQWLAYGFSAAFALVFAFVLLIQPQINKNVKGTEENLEAANQIKERPKFKPEQDLEYRDTYVDSVIYTSKFTETYLDEEIHDKWFKYITDYMFQTWRVPEEKTIEVSAIAKSLVESLKEKTASIDAKFADKSVEALRVTEAEAIQRMADALGTQVKYEAFKRKEREFFEPYIQNQ